MKTLILAATLALASFAASTSHASEQPARNPFTTERTTAYDVVRIYEPYTQTVCYHDTAQAPDKATCTDLRKARLWDASRSPKGAIRRVSQTIAGVGNAPVYYDEGMKLLLTLSERGTYKLLPSSYGGGTFNMRHVQVQGLHRYVDPYSLNICYKRVEQKAICVNPTGAYRNIADLDLSAGTLHQIVPNDANGVGGIFYDAAIKQTLFLTRKGIIFRPLRNHTQEQIDYIMRLSR